MANIQGPAGNYYDKFNTSNPIARYLMDGFIGDFKELFSRTTATKILEVGCGVGDMMSIMSSEREGINLHGFDVDISTLLQTKARFPDSAISFIDGHQIAYADKTFDLVIACEVLEHVINPEQVLSECARLTRNYAIFSVPREPIWRTLNMLRGKYISNLGNTPGHIQHWSSDSFVDMISRYFEVLEVRKPLPWTMVLCQTR